MWQKWLYITSCSFFSHHLGMLLPPCKKLSLAYWKMRGHLDENWGRLANSSIQEPSVFCQLTAHSEVGPVTPQAEAAIPAVPTWTANSPNLEQINHCCFMPLRFWSVVCYIKISWYSHCFYLLAWVHNSKG